MSGSIGGHRINRGDVQPTLDDYIRKVLRPFPGFQDCAITGSYNAGTKKDHGDIDLVVYIDAKDIRKLKKDFKDHLDNLPDDITIPFASGKRKGDKAQLFGTIVTCGFPIHGTSDPVQIDNILVTTKKDATFQRSFLNLNAQKQALFQGLIRVLLQHENPAQIFNHFGLEELPDPGPGQEYEFVLSTSGLSLRLVNLTGGFKELSRTEVWRSNNWNDVEWLLKDYDMDADYEDIIPVVAKKITDSRSRKRIVGIMKSMIRVGPGEVGTPKGDAKEAGIRLVQQALQVENRMASLVNYITESKNNGYMEHLSAYLTESNDNSKFKKSKLKLGTVCYGGDNSDKPMIWVPKQYAQQICDLFDVPNVGDMFLFRDTYYKNQFKIVRGSNYTTGLRQKEFKIRSITKYYIDPIPEELLTSKNFLYDFEDTLKRFMEQQGDRYYERNWMDA